DGPTAIRSSDLVLAMALAAPAGGRSLFDRVVAAAAGNTAFADEWFEGLGYFDAALAPRAVELALDRHFEPDSAIAVIATMLGRPRTRAAAWRAVRARASDLVRALGADHATS